MNLAETNPKHSTEKTGPSKHILLLLGLVFAASFFSIINSASGLNIINALSSADDVVAQLFRSAPNTGELANTLSSGTNLEDSFDRCEIIDPNLDKIYTAGELGSGKTLVPLGENFGGMNAGIAFDSYDSTLNNKVMDYGADLGMSYNIGIFTSPNSASSASSFIEETTERGFIPIVRLCYVGGCDFNGSGDIVTFYKNINILTDKPYVAMLGPNEPGTGEPTEMSGFIGGELPDIRSQYANTATMVNNVAAQFQNERSAGKMYLSPGAFNLSNSENNDVTNLLYGESGATIDLSLFDYLMGNTYAQGLGEVNGMTRGYAYYKQGADDSGRSLYAKAQEFNLPVIITESGIFRDGAMPDSVLIQDGEKMFQEFCKDLYIEGVLFFRSFGEIDDQVRPYVMDIHEISKDQHSQLIGGCKKVLHPYRDWAWASCNFDSCEYEGYEYSSKSVARACGVESDSNSGKGAGLKIVCAGGTCTASKIGTIEVSMPIKQFGSNTSTGTAAHPYAPICAELAGLANFSDESSVYDALNQFAGTLTSSSGDYPMPWLGSGLNCASQLIRYTKELAGSTDTLADVNVHPGSSVLELLNEISDDQYDGRVWERALSVEGPSSRNLSVDLENAANSILDEDAFCQIVDTVTGKKICVDKRSSSDLIGDWRTYNPYNIPLDFEKSSCSSDMIYLKDDSNYIIGPEVVVQEKETVWQGSPSNVCFNYATRNLSGNEGKFIAGADYPELFVSEQARNDARLNCSYNQSQRTPSGLSCANRFCSSESIQDGTCNLEGDYTECFLYADDGMDEFYMTVDSYPSIPKYDVPGAYDALYYMYIRTQNLMSQRGLKLVFGENIGWQNKVSAKIRDGNRGLDDALNPSFPSAEVGEYRYAQQLNSCTVPENIFDNQNLLAKNSPIKTEYQYFDWLGYLDILQELNMAYINDYTFSSEQFVDNEFYVEDPQEFQEKLNSLSDEDKELFEYVASKKKFLESGTSIKTTAYPMFSCDEMAISQLDAQEGSILKRIEDVNCVALRGEDVPYEDKLGLFLCSKGYEVPGLCEDNVCKVSYNVPTNNFTCPVSSGSCWQGPDDDFSHIDLNAVDVIAGDSYDIIAPFDGKVVRAESASEGVEDPFSWCAPGFQKSGGGIWYQGEINGETVTLFFYHVYVSPQDEKDLLGKSFSSGEKITTMSMHCTLDNPGSCSDDMAPTIIDEQGNLSKEGACSSGNHVHIELSKNTPPYGFNEEGDLLTLLYDLGCKQTSEHSCDVEQPSGQELINTGSYSSQCTALCTSADIVDEGVNQVSGQPYITYTTINKNAEFVATRADNINESLDTFKSKVDYAINANLYGSIPEGLFGYDGSFSYDYPSLPGVGKAKAFRYALVEFKNGIPDDTDLNILYTKGDFAFIDITDWFDLDKSQIDNLIDREMKDVKWAVSGTGLYDKTPKGLSRDDDYGNINTDARGRTLIGWDQNGDIVIAVLDASNLDRIVSAFESMKIEVGTILDGGGSSTFYSANGFPQKLGAGAYHQEDKVYVPEGTDIRAVKGYFGAKLEEAQVCEYMPVREGNLSASKSFSSVNCLVKEIADYLSNERGYVIPPELLLSILDRETSMSDESGEPYSGSPVEVAYDQPNSAGAKGPMQFTPETFRGIYENNKAAIDGCLDNLGIEGLGSIDYEDASVIAVGLCAGGVKLSGNVQGLLNSSGISGEVLTQEQWYQPIAQLFPDKVSNLESMANEFFYTQVDLNYPQVGILPLSEITPVHLAARRYLGACNFYSYDGNGNLVIEDGKPIKIATYCDDVYQRSTEKFLGAFDQCTN